MIATQSVTAERAVTAHLPASASSRPYFPALDGLRGIAFLSVFLQHYLLVPWTWAGVDTFFVLSGFLITGILFDWRDDPHRARNFYVRRTLRIFPLYYGLMLLIVLLYPFFRWQWSWLWLTWPLYVGNLIRYAHPLNGSFSCAALGILISRNHPGIELHFGHFWSLCVEEQFYLIWPCVVFYVKDRRMLIVLCAAAVVLCPLVRHLGSHHLPYFMRQGFPDALYFETPFRVDALLVGGLVAMARRGPSTKTLLTAARVGLGLFSVVLLVWVADNPEMHLGLLHDPAHYVYPIWSETWGLSLIDLYAACLVLTALEPGSIAFRLFNLRPLRWVGRISYGAYVYHDILHAPLRDFVLRFTPHYRVLTAALGLVISLPLAWASFRYVESRFLALKESWTR